MFVFKITFGVGTNFYTSVSHWSTQSVWGIGVAYARKHTFDRC